MGAIGMAGDPSFWDVAWNWPLPFLTAVGTLVLPDKRGSMAHLPFYIQTADCNIERSR
jgi:hypothetical protein